MIRIIHQVREYQPFDEGFHLTGSGSQVNWRTKDNGISLLSFFENWGQLVVYGTPAVALAIFQFAGKTAYAS